MKTWENLSRRIERKEKLHFTLIDPDKQSSEAAGEIALFSYLTGTDVILIGGSSGAEESKVEQTIIGIRKKIKKFIPIILFPSGASALSVLADGVLFMSLLNSNDPRYIVREAAKGTLHIKTAGLEPISMGYLIISPGMKVGEIGKADLLRRDDCRKALQYAFFAKYFGAKLLYLEAGSGSPEPVSNEMIRTIKENTGIPLIVGGGIKNRETALEKLKAGADIIVTGNVVEKKEKDQFKEIVKAVREYK